MDGEGADGQSDQGLHCPLIIGYYRMYIWRAKALMIFVYVQDDLNLHILHTFDGTFLLGVAHMVSQ